MNKIEFFKNLIEKLQDKHNPSFSLSLNNVHAEGLFSLVVNGTEPGILTRVFISEKKINPFDIQFHTHRYPLRLTTLKGKIRHHIAQICPPHSSSINTTQYEYKSFLSGGSGLSYKNEVDFSCSDFIIPNGSSITMGVDDFHTVSCSRGSIWIVEEKGLQKESSRVLGVPFVVSGLYSQPGMFQINDMAQLVLRELKSIVKEYELV